MRRNNNYRTRLQVNNLMLPKVCHNPEFPIVISAYTTDSHLGDYYKRATVRLVKSLNKFDLPHMIFPMTPIKNWVEGCSFKPLIIQYALKAFNRPILWIDADGEVNKFPEIFIKNKFDIGLVSYGGHWLTGTLYVNQNCTELINDWVLKTKKEEPDEITLLRLYRSKRYKTKLELLPRSYNEVVHTKTDMDKVIIGHYIRSDVAPSRGVEAVKL